MFSGHAYGLFTSEAIILASPLCTCFQQMIQASTATCGGGHRGESGGGLLYIARDGANARGANARLCVVTGCVVIAGLREREWPCGGLCMQYNFGIDVGSCDIKGDTSILVHRRELEHRKYLSMDLLKWLFSNSGASDPEKRGNVTFKHTS